MSLYLDARYPVYAYWASVKHRTGKKIDRQPSSGLGRVYVIVSDTSIKGVQILSLRKESGARDCLHSAMDRAE